MNFLGECYLQQPEGYLNPNCWCSTNCSTTTSNILIPQVSWLSLSLYICIDLQVKNVKHRFTTVLSKEFTGEVTNIPTGNNSTRVLVNYSFNSVLRIVVKRCRETSLIPF